MYSSTKQLCGLHIHVSGETYLLQRNLGLRLNLLHIKTLHNYELLGAKYSSQITPLSEY
jgi:hypothetical protein